MLLSSTFCFFRKQKTVEHHPQEIVDLWPSIHLKEGVEDTKCHTTRKLIQRFESFLSLAYFEIMIHSFSWYKIMKINRHINTFLNIQSWVLIHNFKIILTSDDKGSCEENKLVHCCYLANVLWLNSSFRVKDHHLKGESSSGYNFIIVARIEKYLSMDLQVCSVGSYAIQFNSSISCHDLDVLWNCTEVLLVANFTLTTLDKWKVKGSQQLSSSLSVP